MECLPRDFFARHHLDVACELLGCELVVGACSGRVVETEGYGYTDDAACHTAFRQQAREFIAAHPAGTAYCYLNYGIHWLLNVLAGDGIVLIRALEPCTGIQTMRARRGRERASELCSGPGKLGQALELGRQVHGRDLAGGEPTFGFRPGCLAGDEEVACGPRIGISRAAELPWRFWIAGNPHVSR